MKFNFSLAETGASDWSDIKSGEQASHKDKWQKLNIVRHNKLFLSEPNKLTAQFAVYRN